MKSELEQKTAQQSQGTFSAVKQDVLDNILLLPPMLDCLERDILTFMLKTQIPQSIMGVRGTLKPKPAYETITMAFKRLEKMGFIQKREGQKGKWFINPLFLRVWLQKRREILIEIAQTPRELRESLYSSNIRVFFNVPEKLLDKYAHLRP